MKSFLYSLVVLFILSACQAGRGMPPHPTMAKTMYKSKPIHHNHVAQKEDFPTLKLKEKSLVKEKTLFTHIPIVNKISSSLLPPIDKIPVLRDIKKLLPKGSNSAKSRLHKQKIRTFQRGESFSGGSPVNGLDIGMVRLGQSRHYTRLIFDSYKWEGYAQLPIEKVNDSGTYIFTYEPQKKCIIGILDGYQAFSALVDSVK